MTFALALMGVTCAYSQVNGFNSGTGYTVNGDASFQGANTLNITNDQYYENNAVYYNTPVSVGAFTASFNFQLNPSYPNDGLSPADGFTFVLQNDPRNTAAVGDAGGNLGYDGGNPVTPSIAVAFNVYSGHTIGTNFLTGGNNPQNYNDVSPVQWLTDPVNVTLNYNGTNLVETLTDLTTSATYQASYAVDISSTVGGSTAYVGFTGGTGSGTSTQEISNFQFAAVPEPSSFAALGLPLIGLLGLRRRRTRTP